MVHVLFFAATLGLLSPLGASGQETPQVYIDPSMCNGVILLGRCFGCPWDGPVTSGSGGFRPPVELKIEEGEFICGCADAWRPSVAKPDCDITRLTDDELAALATREGGGVYYGLEFFN